MDPTILVICLSLSMVSAGLSWNISYISKSRGWYYMTAAFLLAGYNRAALELSQPYYVTRLLWIMVSLLLMSGLILVRASLVSRHANITRINSDLESTACRLKDS